VYTTGETFSANELPLQINSNGTIDTVYINFSYEPLYNASGKIDGILASGIGVTEQVTARKKIEESKAELQNLFKQAPVTIVVYKGKDHIVEVANTAALEMWGKSEDDVLNKPFFEITPELRESQEPLLKKVYESGESYFGKEFSVTYTKNGKSYSGYFNFVYQPVRDTENKITGIIAIGTEVTEAVLNRQKIEASEKSFRLLADSMPQHIWTADPQGNLNYFNQSVFDFTGLTLEQLKNGGWLQVVHADEREKNKEAWLASVTTGKDYIVEHRFRNYDGQYRWQLSRAKPQLDENGAIKLWVGTSTDIHDQVNFRDELENKVKQRTAELIKLNESLKKSEERYHRMVEEVQEYAILYINREGIVENWNSGAEKIKGYKAEEIIGKSFSNFYTDEDRRNKLPQKLLDMALRNGKA
ncbi:MAG: MEKHLA domain-containing protein, partial [Pricia sp.]|nr:MEKHLA domain-containing protein [Pricia sp.]